MTTKQRAFSMVNAGLAGWAIADISIEGSEALSMGIAGGAVILVLGLVAWNWLRVAALGERSL